MRDAGGNRGAGDNVFLISFGHRHQYCERSTGGICLMSQYGTQQLPPTKRHSEDTEDRGESKNKNQDDESIK